MIKAGLASGLEEIERHWSLEDIWEAIEVIGVMQDIQDIQSDAEKEEAKGRDK